MSLRAAAIVFASISIAFSPDGICATVPPARRKAKQGAGVRPVDYGAAMAWLISSVRR